MSIYLINLDNLFGSNGSRLKPNRVIELDDFYFEQHKYPTGESQEISGGIELEGEGNYAYCEGNYYFLDKIKVSHAGKAGIYAMTKDFGASWLEKGITVKGICNKTDNEKLIYENLDLVHTLVDDPCQLVRMNLKHDDTKGHANMEIIPPKRGAETFKYISNEDGNRFYNQVKNAKKPSNTSLDKKSLVVIGALEATGEAQYKKNIYQRLQQFISELRSGKTNYIPSRFDIAKGLSPQIQNQFCISPRDFSLGIHKEYIKILKLDFSGLTDIVPKSLTTLEGAAKDGSSTKFSKSSTNDKMYRELKQRVYLPYFNGINDNIKGDPQKDQLHVIGYRGDLSQYVKTKSQAGQIFLDYIPQLNTTLDANGVMKPTKDYGCLGIQIFNVFKNGCGTRYDKDEPLDHLEFLSGLKKGGDVVELQYPKNTPLDSFDMSRAIYETLGPNAGRVYLKNTNDDDIDTFEGYPEHFKQKLILMKSSLDKAMTIHRGDHIGTDLDYYWNKKDDYDSSSKFLDSNNHFGNQEELTKTDFNDCVVAVYDPIDQNYQLKKLTKHYYEVPLAQLDENDVEGVSFPHSKSINARTYRDIQFRQGQSKRVTVTTLTEVKPKEAIGTQSLEKEEGKKALQKNRHLWDELKDSLRYLKNLGDKSDKWTYKADTQIGYNRKGLTEEDVSSEDKLGDLVNSRDKDWIHNTDTINGGGVGIRKDLSGFTHGLTSAAEGAGGNIGLRSLSGILKFNLNGINYVVGGKNFTDMDEHLQKIGRLLSYQIRWISSTSHSDMFKKATPSELANSIDTDQAKASICFALDKVVATSSGIKIIDDSEHKFQPNEMQCFDLVGTKYYAILDVKNNFHLVFKSPEEGDPDIITNISEDYIVTNEQVDEEGDPIEIQQDIVDILCQKNVLRVLTADFEINDRIIWNNLDGRGTNSRPKVRIQRYTPTNKRSPMENFIINFQSPRANIDVRMQFPKVMNNYQEYDPIAVESLKFEMARGKANFEEERKVRIERNRREELRIDEMKRANALEGQRTGINLMVGGFSLAGNVGANIAATMSGGTLAPVTLGMAANAGGQLAHLVTGIQQQTLKTTGLFRDVALRATEIAYDRFKLDQEEYWKKERFKFDLAKISSNYVVGEVNDRDMVEKYSEMYGVDEVFLLHFTLSPVQKQLAKNGFDHYGANCLIPEVTLHIQNGMPIGIGGFFEINAFENVYQDPERKLVEGILKNGIRVIEYFDHVKRVPPKPPTIETWAERAGKVIQEATPEQREIILKAIMTSLDPVTVLNFIKEKFNYEHKIIEGILQLASDKTSLVKELHKEVPTVELYEALKESEVMDELLDLELDHSRGKVLRKFTANQQNFLDMIENSEGKLMLTEEAQLEIQKVKDGVYNDIYDASRRCYWLTEMVKPFLLGKSYSSQPVAKYIVETYSSSTYGSPYQTQDYAALEFNSSTFTFSLFNYYPKTCTYPSGRRGTISGDNSKKMTYDEAYFYQVSNDQFSNLKEEVRSKDFMYKLSEHGHPIVIDKRFADPSSSGIIYSNSRMQSDFYNKSSSQLCGDTVGHHLTTSSSDIDNKVYITTQQEGYNTMVLMKDLVDKYKPKGN